MEVCSLTWKRMAISALINPKSPGRIGRYLCRKQSASDWPARNVLMGIGCRVRSRCAAVSASSRSDATAVSMNGKLRPCCPRLAGRPSALTHRARRRSGSRRRRVVSQFGFLPTVRIATPPNRSWNQDRVYGLTARTGPPVFICRAVRRPAVH